MGGRGLTKSLLEMGAEVWAVSRTLANLESLKDECSSSLLHIVPVDLTDWEATRSALSPLPRMDGLVNNAAVAICTPFLQVTPGEIDLLLNANVKQVINVTQIVVGKMVTEKQPGSVVNVSSQASQAALGDHTVYCATKGALDMVTKVAALEFGPHQVRVNAVNPTVTMTLPRFPWAGLQRSMMWFSVFFSSWALAPPSSTGSRCRLMGASLPPKNIPFEVFKCVLNFEMGTN